jgi:hypothetical protein
MCDAAEYDQYIRLWLVEARDMCDILPRNNVSFISLWGHGHELYHRTTYMSATKWKAPMVSRNSMPGLPCGPLLILFTSFH